MKIDTNRFTEWLKHEIKLSTAEMHRCANGGLYEMAAERKIETQVFESILDCIERPGYNDIDWMIEDEG